MLSAKTKAKTTIKNYMKQLVQKHCIAIYVLMATTTIIYHETPSLHTIYGQIEGLAVLSAAVGLVVYHGGWRSSSLKKQSQ